MSEGFFDDITTVREISSGGYGKVYEICKGKYDKVTCDGDLYAEKVYTEGEPDFNEIDILSRFDHPNLLKSVKSHLDSKGKFHLVLPLADKSNYDLKKIIEKGKMPLTKAIIYMYQIISAVGFLHSQEYYHCDIKPQNILMFNDNCVLADYGFTYQSSYNMEICGTVGYASPQGWNNRGSFDWKYYKEELNQIQGDIYSIGATFFECLTGEQLNDYNLYIKDEDYDEADNKAYQEAEDYILRYLEHNKSKNEYKLAFDCIYNMCRNSQKDRYKTIDEVLQHPLFVSRTMTRIIPGKIKATKMPDVCKSLIGTTIESLIDKNERLFIFLQRDNPFSLLVHITLYTLLHRTMYLLKELSNFTLHYISCLYLSIAIFKPINLTYEYLSAVSGNQHKPESIREMVYKIVDELDGVIRVPTIYEETDNALEIVWWLLNLSKDCSYLVKSPKELHSMYAEIEAKNQKLILSRINKNSVLFIYKLIDNRYKIEYKIEDEIKTITLSDKNY